MRVDVLEMNDVRFESAHQSREFFFGLAAEDAAPEHAQPRRHAFVAVQIAKINVADEKVCVRIGLIAGSRHREKSDLVTMVAQRVCERERIRAVAATCVMPCVRE
jgi:hypothetical protein